MKIATIVGARPQFIKASAVSKEIKKHSMLEEVLIHTGQHFDDNMSEIFFSQLDMDNPKYNLNISGGRHGHMTGSMIMAIENVLLDERPDLVLVYGDTNSTLAAAISASKLIIPIAHVEAGLRSKNMRMPEEINRVLTDRISQLLFTPSQSADENLLHEGIAKDKIVRSGDVMLDVLIEFSTSHETARSREFENGDQAYVLATLHRQENTNDSESWNRIMELLSSISEFIPVIWPVHPRVASIIPERIKQNKRVTLVDPLGYYEMIGSVRHSKFVITDSGGLQKEAFFLKVPCITLRDETEWTELVEIGWNMLLPPNEIVKDSVRRILDFSPSNSSMREVYGNGSAAQIIVNKFASL